MKHRSIDGDDSINAILMGAMAETVYALQDGGLISDTNANRFLDEHICVLAANDGGFLVWLKRRFGQDGIADMSISRIVVACIKTKKKPQ